MADDRKILAPQPNPETKAYWDAASEGKLLIKRCKSCGKPHFYPRALCPFCFSADTVWEQSKGRGVIYSYSAMRRAPVPFCLAYVTLEEGPTMMTNLVDCDFDEIAIGQKVRVTFKPTDGGPPVPMFTPE